MFMLKRDIAIGIAVFFIGACIILNGFFNSTIVKPTNSLSSSTTPADKKVLNLSEVAAYLNMPEYEIEGIINAESNELKKTGSFSGKMFPYIIIDSKKFFYKDEIDEWLKEASSTHREYNTASGWVLH